MPRRLTITVPDSFDVVMRTLATLPPDAEPDDLVIDDDARVGWILGTLSALLVRYGFRQVARELVLVNGNVVGQLADVGDVQH